MSTSRARSPDTQNTHRLFCTPPQQDNETRTNESAPCSRLQRERSGIRNGGDGDHKSRFFTQTAKSSDDDETTTNQRKNETAAAAELEHGHGREQCATDNNTLLHSNNNN